MRQEKHLVRGVLAGIAGGLVASWVMNQFIAGPGQSLQQAVASEDEKKQQQQQQRQQQASGEPPVDPTMKTADAIVSTVTGDHLSLEDRQQAGPVVHYTFGALMGGLYGGLAEYSSTARSGFGTSFGGALFTGADLLAVPAFHLSPPLNQQPKSGLATPFAAHLVYGATTELVRRIVRAIL